MKEIHIHKAQPLTHQTEPVESLQIIADKDMPDFQGDWRKQYRDLYEQDAALIADAIFLTLPGGTISALLREMLKRHAAALWAVSFWSKDERKKHD